MSTSRKNEKVNESKLTQRKPSSLKKITGSNSDSPHSGSNSTRSFDSQSPSIVPCALGEKNEQPPSIVYLPSEQKKTSIVPLDPKPQEAEPDSPNSDSESSIDEELEKILQLEESRKKEQEEKNKNHDDHVLSITPSVAGPRDSTPESLIIEVKEQKSNQNPSQSAEAKGQPLESDQKSSQSTAEKTDNNDQNDNDSSCSQNCTGVAMKVARKVLSITFAAIATLPAKAGYDFIDSQVNPDEGSPLYYGLIAATGVVALGLFFSAYTGIDSSFNHWDISQKKMDKLKSKQKTLKKQFDAIIKILNFREKEQRKKEELIGNEFKGQIASIQKELADVKKELKHAQEINEGLLTILNCREESRNLASGNRIGLFSSSTSGGSSPSPSIVISSPPSSLSLPIVSISSPTSSNDSPGLNKTPGLFSPTVSSISDFPLVSKADSVNPVSPDPVKKDI